VSEEAKVLIGNQGYDPAYGARPLKRVIQKELENPLSIAILDGQYKAGDEIKVEVEADQIKIN